MKALLRPCDPERVKIWPVSKKVGSVSNDGRELVEPIELVACDIPRFNCIKA